MATSTIQLSVRRAQYPSLQIGDILFYVNSDNNEFTGGFNTSANNTPVKIGKITNIENGQTSAQGVTVNENAGEFVEFQNGLSIILITCEVDNSTPLPLVSNSSFLFFQKDNKVNSTSLLGYFAKMQFKNNSTERAELFTVSCEISESSK
tara:strand:- start:10803 stop:11252 length:450 start_codon:yes stop_codon:yes gene_type:complete